MNTDIVVFAKVYDPEHACGASLHLKSPSPDGVVNPSQW